MLQASPESEQNMNDIKLNHRIAAHSGDPQVFAGENAKTVQEASINPLLMIMLAFLVLFPVVIRLLPHTQSIESYLDALYK